MEITSVPNPWTASPLDEFRLFAVLGTWMEEDVVGATVKNAFAQGCERVYLVDNASSDRTVAEALAAGAVLARTYETPQYDEALRLKLMNEVASQESAAEKCAHVWWLYLDADEFHHGPSGMTVREYLAGIDRVFRVVGARFFDHFPSGGIEYESGRHPLDFQPLCHEVSFPMCARMHRKHPLQRFDRGASPIVCGPGFHRVECTEPLYEPSEAVFLHHFPYRSQARTRERLEALWAKRRDGTARARESRDTHMLARRDSLDAVYAQDWARVRNFIALDPMYSKLPDPPPAVGLQLKPWQQAVAAEHVACARWYGEEPQGRTAAAPVDAFGEELARELDEWTRAGLRARFWVRDDDAATDTPALRKLLAIGERFTVPLALAVVPARADASLVEAVRGRRSVIWQHGWSHEFHNDGEFGESRKLATMIGEAVKGQRALDALFGPDGWHRVFVPPNHALSVAFKAIAPSLEYEAVSAGDPRTSGVPGVRELNANVDLMDWPRWKVHSRESIGDHIAAELRRRRTGGEATSAPIGLLTHHLPFDDAAWETFGALLAYLREKPCTQWPDPIELIREGSSAAVAANDVTVVLTSCGRPDLLERTIDSFLANNTYPIREFIIMEDGPVISPLAGTERYRGKFRWLCTGRRVGQMASIDTAYREVSTPFIFHCEDDWEFYASGFIEKSFRVMRSDPRILQVWLRGIADTNNHPLEDETLVVDSTEYRLLRTEHDSGEWGTWHGFSLNPGLRRRRDYVLLGSFSGLSPDGRASSSEVERLAAEVYWKHGLRAAILADENGRGYVRHLGWGRHVEEP